jgi:hypothetical protein
MLHTKATASQGACNTKTGLTHGQGKCIPMTQAEISNTIDLSDFGLGLPNDAESLIALFDGYKAATSAIEGVYNQPRTTPAAGDYLQGEMERLGTMMDAIVVKLKSLKEVSKYSRQQLLRVLVENVFLVGDDPAEMIMALAKTNQLATAN